MTYGEFRATRAGEWLRFAFLCVRFAAAIALFPVAFWWLLMDGMEAASWWASRAGAGGVLLDPCLLVGGFFASGYVALRLALWAAGVPTRAER